MQNLISRKKNWTSNFCKIVSKALTMCLNLLPSNSKSATTQHWQQWVLRYKVTFILPIYLEWYSWISKEVHKNSNFQACKLLKGA